MKINFLISIFILLFNFSNSQTIKDFFIPKKGLKTAVFKQDGRITDTLIYSKQDSIYIINIKLENITITYKYKITNDEVIQILWQSEGDGYIESENFNTVELKMPKKDSIVEWIFNDRGEYNSCKAELTEININNEIKKAIKVTYKTYLNNNIKSNIKEWYTIQYYVEGLGFYRRERCSNTGQFGSLEELDKIE